MKSRDRKLFEIFVKKVLTTTVRYDNIMTTKGGDDMMKLIIAIKKAFAHRQAEQKRIARNNHSWEQAQLMVKALEDRDY